MIGQEDRILWADASESPLAMPDSRARWEAIWSRRGELIELAHSHPLGPTAFSKEDESTMAALAMALGRSLTFSVISPWGMVRRIGSSTTSVRTSEEPWWTQLLRIASGLRVA